MIYKKYLIRYLLNYKKSIWSVSSVLTYFARLVSLPPPGSPLMQLALTCRWHIKTLGQQLPSRSVRGQFHFLHISWGLNVPLSVAQLSWMKEGEWGVLLLPDSCQDTGYRFQWHNLSSLPFPWPAPCSFCLLLLHLWPLYLIFPLSFLCHFLQPSYF